MPGTNTSRRSLRPRTVVLIGLGLALLCGIGGWLVLYKDSGERCNGLLESEGLLRTVATTDAGRPATCAELGEAITKATTGSKPGHHTLPQAEAMKSILYALVPPQGHRVRLDPALREPLASALADYSADTYARLHSLDPAYTTNAGAENPPWQDAQGVHMAVDYIHLLNVLVAVSEDPKAYATVRMATTRYAAQDLASVPADAVGDDLSLPSTRSARALGAMNGVALAAHQRLGDEGARTWQTQVAATLLASPAENPSVEENPSGRLTSAWISGLRATP